MSPRSRRFGLCIALVVLLGIPSVLAADYYVDDDCDGDGVGTIEDPFCTLQEAADIARAGDTVYVRAGVYRETLTSRYSGTDKNNMITFKAYPGEGCQGGYTKTNCQVVIDGSTPVTGTWTQCPSQAACGDNPNWQDIYYIDLDDSIAGALLDAINADADLAPIFEDNQRLMYAHDPTQDTPYFPWGIYDPDLPWEGYYYAESIGSNSLYDSINLNQPDGFWVGAYVKFRAGDSTKRYRQITGFASNTLSWDEPLDISPFNDGYILMNHMPILEQPGELYIDYNSDPKRMYMISTNMQNPQAHKISVIVGPDIGVDLSQADYIRIEGFEIAKFSENAIRIFTSLPNQREGIEIVNNNIHHSNGHVIYVVNGKDLLIENNEIHKNVMTGIQVTGKSLANNENILIRGNYIHYNGKDGVHAEGNNVTIENNLIGDQFHTDSHQDALEIYGPNDGLVIKNNIVWDTTQNVYISAGWGHIRNVEVIGNLVYCENSCHLGFKGLLVGPSSADITNITIEGNTFVNNWAHMVTDAYTTNEDYWVKNLIVRNNIFYTNESGHGYVDFNIRTSELVNDYNLYYNIQVRDDDYHSYDTWIVGPTSIRDQDPLFVNENIFDYHLSEGSPAIDRGVDLTGILDFDIDGTPRPQDGDNSGTAEYDIGAYEFQSGTVECTENADCTDGSDCTGDVCDSGSCRYINYNLDNSETIGLGDIIQILFYWGLRDTDPGWNPAVDLREDGNIGLSDIIVLIGVWGEFC